MTFPSKRKTWPRRRTMTFTKKAGYSAIVASVGYIKFVLYSILARIRTSDLNMHVHDVPLQSVRRQVVWKQLQLLLWQKIFREPCCQNTLRITFELKLKSLLRLSRRQKLNENKFQSKKLEKSCKWVVLLPFDK